ncbi:MAG: hypothetical protein JXR37_26125 [Kiritimatiellae bacterium]|nr:hypothetical protein [Kiritimatiellia bacterium]
MKRNTALKVLNPILGLLVLGQAVSALLHDAMGDELFEGIHGGGGALLMLCVVLHLVLNRQWIQASYFRRGKSEGVS